MKKYFLIWMMLSCSLIYAQTASVNATINSAQTVSDTVTIPANTEIVGLIVPQGLTDSLYVYAGYLQGGNLYQVNTDAATYIIKCDSSKTSIISFSENSNLLESYRYISFKSNDAAISSKVIGVIYKQRR